MSQNEDINMSNSGGQNTGQQAPQPSQQQDQPRLSTPQNVGEQNSGQAAQASQQQHQPQPMSQAPNYAMMGNMMASNPQFQQFMRMMGSMMAQGGFGGAPQSIIPYDSGVGGSYRPQPVEQGISPQRHCHNHNSNRNQFPATQVVSQNVQGGRVFQDSTVQDHMAEVCIMSCL